MLLKSSYKTKRTYAIFINFILDILQQHAPISKSLAFTFCLFTAAAMISYFDHLIFVIPS
jgi:hypothetical protein